MKMYMEWWIPLLIILGILGFVAVIIIIIVVVSSSNQNGDYNDGGGKQIGAPGQPTIFMSPQETKGIEGERLANFSLRKLLREDEYLLCNVLLPLKSGRKTEIDSIIISRKGIFFI